MVRKARWLPLLLLVALVLALPLVLNLEVFRGHVHRAVERQLGRPVEFDSLTAQLLPWPGVVGRGVRVFDADSFGAEPMVYAEEVHCHLSLDILRKGRLEFAEIFFQRPSLNLVRNAEGEWNVAALLLGQNAPVGESSAAAGLIPVLSATEGRINFKFGADKQMYALTSVRLRLTPLPEGRWRLQLEATPVRGDRRLTETGTVQLEGEIGRAAEFSRLPFRFQAGLQRGSLSQWAALLTGTEPVIRARTSLTATVEGTPAAWQVEGSARLAGLRHRDLVAPPRSPRWEVQFRLQVLGEGDTVRVESAAVRTRRSELRLAGRVDGIRTDPRWDVNVEAEKIALDELMTQWAGLKAGSSTKAQLGGNAGLVLTARGPLQSWQGLLTADGVALKAPDLPAPLTVGSLQMRLRGGRLELAPARLQFSPEDALEVRGDWRLATAGRPYRLHWQSAGVDLEVLQKATRTFGWDFLGPARWHGRAQGEMDWRGQFDTADPGPRWEGRAEIREVKFHPPEFNQPLEILEARLTWQRQNLTVAPLVVRLGENAVSGSLERQRTGRWAASLAVGELSLATLDELLNPAPRGLLARLVGSESRPATRWKELEATGEVKVEELAAGPLRFRKLQAEGKLASGRLELTRLRFRVYGGRFDGRFQGDFQLSPPQYRLAGNFKQLELGAFLAETTELDSLFGGMVGADVSLQTAGTTPDELLRRLQGRVVGVLHDGVIAHLNMLAAMASAAEREQVGQAVRPQTELQSLAGEFRVADRQVGLDGVRMTLDGASLELTGRVRFDGSLDLELRGEPLLVAGRPVPPATRALFNSTYRITGSLRRPLVELAEPAATGR